MPELLTTREAAEYLRVSPETFCRWARRHRVPRIGQTHCRWRLADIRAAVDEALRGAIRASRRSRSRASHADRLTAIRKSCSRGGH